MPEDRAGPAVVIAAGGAGSRIGGAKPDRLLGGRRLIDRAIDWARSQSDCSALAVGPGERRGDIPCLVDEAPDLGPIAALASAMRFAARQGRAQVLLIGCDTPFLPGDLAARLGKALDPGPGAESGEGSGQSGAALPRRDGRLHPLAGLWRSDPEGIAAWIAAGGRSLWGYAEQAGLVVVDWPGDGADPFANINTADDLRAAEARLTAPGR